MISTNVKYIAIGMSLYSADHILLTTDHPRKELMEVLGAKHADKMYCDPNRDHIGYVIHGQWYTIYAVEGRGPRTKRSTK